MTSPEAQVASPEQELADLNETDSDKDFITKLFDRVEGQSYAVADEIAGFADFSEESGVVVPKLIAYTHAINTPETDCETVVVWNVSPGRKITSEKAVILVRDIFDLENLGPVRAFSTRQMQKGIVPLHSKYADDHSEPHDMIFRSVELALFGEIKLETLNYSQARREIGDLKSPKIDFMPY